jgi:hypothetical protein
MIITGGYLGAAQAIRDELAAFAKISMNSAGRPALLSGGARHGRPPGGDRFCPAAGMPYCPQGPIAELNGPKTHAAATPLSKTGTARFLHGAVIGVTA